MKQLTFDTSFDRITSYALGEIEEDRLQPGEKDMFLRWRTAYALLLDFNTTKQAVKRLVAKFPDISERTAYRDVKKSQELFGNVYKADKEGLRHILSEQCKEAMKLALQNKDLKAYAMLQANMIKITGLDKDDPMLPDFSKLQQHSITIDIPSNTLKVLEKLVKSGSLNLSDLISEQDILDVEHQEE